MNLETVSGEIDTATELSCDLLDRVGEAVFGPQWFVMDEWRGNVCKAMGEGFLLPAAFLMLDRYLPGWGGNLEKIVGSEEFWFRVIHPAYGFEFHSKRDHDGVQFDRDPALAVVRSLLSCARWQTTLRGK